METTQLKTIALSSDMMDANQISSAFTQLTEVRNVELNGSIHHKDSNAAVIVRNDGNIQIYDLGDGISKYADKTAGYCSLTIGRGVALSGGSETATKSAKYMIAHGSSTAANSYACAFGGGNKAYGYSSFCIGANNQAGDLSAADTNAKQGNYTVMMGRNNYCKGGYSVVEGADNKDYKGLYQSHLEGGNNVISCAENQLVSNSHVEGYYNEIYGNVVNSHIDGKQNVVHPIGDISRSTVDSRYSNFHGTITDSFVGGAVNYILSSNRSNIDGFGLSVDNCYVSHIEGNQNSVDYAYASYIGGNSNIVKSNNNLYVVGNSNTIGLSANGSEIHGYHNTLYDNPTSFTWNGYEYLYIGNQIFGNYSNVLSGTQFSTVFGWSNAISSKVGFVAGLKAQSNDDFSFVWNGLSSYNGRYPSHGEGTFNVNPKNGLSGFYIGNNNFLSCIVEAIKSIAADSTMKSLLKTELNKILA